MSTVLNSQELILGAILGLVSATCSITISKRFLFQAMRQALKRRWERTGRTLDHYIYEGACCHWCLSFHISLVLNLLCWPKPLTTGRGWFIDFGLTEFYVWAIASITLALVFDRVVAHRAVEAVPVPLSPPLVVEREESSTLQMQDALARLYALAEKLDGRREHKAA